MFRGGRVLMNSKHRLGAYALGGVLERIMIKGAIELDEEVAAPEERVSIIAQVEGGEDDYGLGWDPIELGQELLP